MNAIIVLVSRTVIAGLQESAYGSDTLHTPFIIITTKRAILLLSTSHLPTDPDWTPRPLYQNKTWDIILLLSKHATYVPQNNEKIWSVM